MADEKEPTLMLSMQIDGASFSATGPRSQVLALYAEWKDLSGFHVAESPANTFNGPRLVQH